MTDKKETEMKTKREKNKREREIIRKGKIGNERRMC